MEGREAEFRRKEVESSLSLGGGGGLRAADSEPLAGLSRRERPSRRERKKEERRATIELRNRGRGKRKSPFPPSYYLLALISRISISGIPFRAIYVNSFHVRGGMGSRIKGGKGEREGEEALFLILKATANSAKPDLIYFFPPSWYQLL